MYVPYEWKLKTNEITQLKPNTKFAVMYSGGKDSALALSLTINQGELCSLLHCVDENSCRSLFHNQSLDIICEHAKRLNVPIYYLDNKWWIKWDRVVSQYIKLKNQGVEAIVFGDLGSEDNIEIQYKICVASGLKPCFPLYRKKYDDLLDYIEKYNITSIITKLNDEKIPIEWLGEKYDKKSYEFLKKLEIDAFGENGEFHTTVVGADFLDGDIKYSVSKYANKSAIININV
mgnify:CR=1 FL=1